MVEIGDVNHQVRFQEAHLIPGKRGGGGGGGGIGINTNFSACVASFHIFESSFHVRDSTSSSILEPSYLAPSLGILTSTEDI